MLKQAFRLFEGGRKWGQGTYKSDDGGYCALGAIYEMPRSTWSAAGSLLYRVLERKNGADCSVVGYNDSERCEFKHIRALYREAYKLAKKEEDGK